LQILQPNLPLWNAVTTVSNSATWPSMYLAAQGQEGRGAWEGGRRAAGTVHEFHSGHSTAVVGQNIRCCELFLARQPPADLLGRPWRKFPRPRASWAQQQGRRRCRCPHAWWATVLPLTPTRALLPRGSVGSSRCLPGSCATWGRSCTHAPRWLSRAEPA
jgi:hypothetical protein